MKRGAHHQKVGALRPARTAFDLSYEKKFTCDFGEIIPVQCDEVVPGDHFSMAVQAVLRTQPMFAPLLHEIKCSFHAFFVPYRLLMNDWEAFITGGPDGTYVSSLPLYPPAMYVNSANVLINVAGQGGKRTYWDYFGFPLTSTTGEQGSHYAAITNTNGYRPMAFPLRALNLIWEEFIRDENYQARCRHSSWTDIIDKTRDLSELDFIPNAFSDRPLLPYLRSWTKDYFTSALPFQQRGQAPAFPISGQLPVFFNPSSSTLPLFVANALGTPPLDIPVNQNASGPNNALYPSQASGVSGSNPAYVRLPSGVVNLNESVSFNVNDLRRIVQLQKWLERNARGGVRYTEFLRSHFGVTPNDDRLQRPEYIGGLTQNITVSEVLQTSQNAGNQSGSAIDATPQGNMSGHGLMACNGRIGKYFAKEYGLIMTLMSIMPTPSYEDGIDRQWRRRVNTDFYFPEFVNLSEQGIENAEIYAQGTAVDNNLWGYQPQYDEMRIKRNIVCGEFRNNSSNNLSFWHLGRHFTSLPNLGSNFIRLTPTQFNRCFSVANFQHFIVSVGNIIKAVRPLPYIGEPGLVDHH